MIDMKCMCLQEDFLKEAVLMQVRMLLDRRNLKFNNQENDYSFAS